MVSSSCSKAVLSDNSDSVTKSIRLNVTVAGLGSDDPATKAKIKTAWADGDVISIYYDSSTSKSFDITYDGSKWTGPENIAAPGSASGTVKCLYNGTIKVASTDSYTFSEDVLSFSITGWKFLTEIQVVVSGLSSSQAQNYTLACDKFTPLSGGGFAVGTDAITAALGTKGTPVTGIANFDGVAFVFATASYSDDEQNLLFTLTNTTEPLATRIVKGYSLNKVIDEDASKIKAYKISKDKFQKCVQLWAGGPKWAYNNIGAESATGYGYYFAWGYTDGYVHNGYNWETPDLYKENTFDSTGFPDYKTHTYSDMASAGWGPGWKLPGWTELDNLRYNTVIDMVTTGVKGIKFIGRGTYSAASIFLPAAGSGYDSKTYQVGSFGYYWTSKQYDNDEAYYFAFDENAFAYSYNDKFEGYSVRPVWVGTTVDNPWGGEEIEK